MRASRLRLSDFARLLILQYPVRCENCQQRDYALLFNALKLPRHP
jgi:hypothetical protein